MEIETNEKVNYTLENSETITIDSLDADIEAGGADRTHQIMPAIVGILYWLA